MGRRGSKPGKPQSWRSVKIRRTFGNPAACTVAGLRHDAAMPSPFEHEILFYILTAVLASVPLALLVRTYFPHRTAGERAATRMAAEAVPAQVTVSPPPPPAWINPEPEVSSDPWSPPHTKVGSTPPVEGTSGWVWTKKDAWFAAVLTLIVAFLLGPMPAAAAAQSGTDPAANSVTIPMPTLFILSMFMQAMLIGMVLAYLGLHRRLDVVSLFGLRRLSPLKAAGLAVLIIVPTLVALNYISYYAIQLLQYLTSMELKPQTLVEKAPGITDPVARVLMFLALCVGAPLMEELIFRGVLFSVASKFIHPVYAMVASSVFFGVIHNNLLVLIPLTLLGMVLAYVYQRTRSLLVPVMMHSMFNAITFLFLFYGPPELR